MPTDRAQVCLANTINTLPQLKPIATTTSITTNMDSSIATQSSVMSTIAATMPITMDVAEGIAASNNGNQLSLKNVQPKSTFVQLSNLVNQKINISCQKQGFMQSTKIPKTLQETKLKNEKEVSKIPFSMNIGILGNFSKPNCLEPEMNNPLFPVLQSSHVNSVSILEKNNKNSSSFHCETLNNDLTREFLKIDDSNLNEESCQITKLTTFNDRTLISKENTEVHDASSTLDQIYVSIANQTKKRPRGRPRKSLIPPKYKQKRQFPILPAIKNIGINDTKQLSNGNLVWSGNYLIFFQNEQNDKSDMLGIHCEEPKENVSQSETGTRLTFTRKNNGSKIKNKQLSLRKEMQKYLNKEKIIITTEQVANELGGNSECYKSSEHCTSSVKCPTNIEIETETTNEEKIIVKAERVDDETGENSEHSNVTYLEIQEENKSEPELVHTIPEKSEDNELVTTDYFSLLMQAESKRKFPFNNLLKKKNLEDSNVSQKIPHSKCPVTLEQLNSFSDSIVSSPTDENQILCSKSAENGEIFYDSSTKKDKRKKKTLNEFMLQETGLKWADDVSLNRSISAADGEHLPVDISHVDSKFRMLPISSDILLTLHRVQNSLTSNKSFDVSSLQSSDHSLIGNLTKDKKADVYIDGCITFHEKQIYLLQLQINQHQTALEKLKAAQNCLN